MPAQFPVLSKAALEALDDLFPHRCPTMDMTDRQIWIASGKRELVDRLILEYRRAQEKA